MANARAGEAKESTHSLDREPESASPSPSRSWRTHLALLVVQFAFGSQAVEGKLAMLPRAAGGAGLEPEAIAMARMIGAAVFFQVLEWVLRKRARGSKRGRGSGSGRGSGEPAPLTPRDHVVLFGLSVLGISINQTLFLLGLRMTAPVSAALLSVTIPVFTAVLAVGARQERVSVRLVIGLVLALTGALALTGVTHVDRGATLVLVNSLSYALYLVLGRRVIQRLGALTVICWIFTWGALSFLPIGLVPLIAALRDLSPLGAWLLAYILVVPTIIAYLANAWALGRSSATLVTIYIYLQPLIAGALAYVQLGQPVASKALLAGVLILSGVTVVASRGRRSATSP